MKATVRIGTQGWNYDGWVGPFYPQGTPKKDMLPQYAKIFDTVEIDSTFYAIPAENSVRLWKERTPQGFVFSLKLPSEITHKNRLRDSRQHLIQFLNRMALLKEKLGCILIQLPPDFSPFEQAALKDFLSLLPREMKFAVEFRDKGWLSEQTFSTLGEREVALALTDSKWIGRQKSFHLIDSPTSSFAYVRWLGPRDLTDFSHVQFDRSKELKQWAEAFQMLREKVDTVFGYFNNHFQGHSPASCNQFKKLIGLPTVDPDALVVQPLLF